MNLPPRADTEERRPATRSRAAFREQPQFVARPHRRIRWRDRRSCLRTEDVDAARARRDRPRSAPESKPLEAARLRDLLALAPQFARLPHESPRRCQPGSRVSPVGPRAGRARRRQLPRTSRSFGRRGGRISECVSASRRNSTRNGGSVHRLARVRMSRRNPQARPAGPFRDRRRRVRRPVHGSAQLTLVTSRSTTPSHEIALVDASGSGVSCMARDLA